MLVCEIKNYHGRRQGDGLVANVTGNIASDRLAKQEGIMKRIYEESQ